MVALTAANVTVTVERRGIEGQRKRNRVKITFGDGALTYPTGGVPMPAKTAYGMAQTLDFLHMIDNSATGIMWKYDKTNNKLVAYVETTVATNATLIEATTALAPPAQTIYMEAVGW